LSSSEPNFEATTETIALADEAVLVFPNSPKLWCMRGDLIQLASESCSHSLEDAEACFLRAIDIDPSFAEAYEELGHFYDAVMDDEKRAESYFAEFRRLQTHRENTRNA
jgi:tetratricopeptide (TPR) repeat protein